MTPTPPSPATAPAPPAAARSGLYTEFRRDGWPFCPRCEDDELYSLLMLDYHGLPGQGEPPTLAECLAGPMCRPPTGDPPRRVIVR